LAKIYPISSEFFLEQKKFKNVEDSNNSTKINVIKQNLSFEDAEIETTPTMPKIPDNQPLPDDLQDLLNRCKQLSRAEGPDRE